MCQVLVMIHHGFANWKNASGKTGGFCKHESSSLHKQADEVIYTLPRTIPDVNVTRFAKTRNNPANKHFQYKALQNLV